MQLKENVCHCAHNEGGKAEPVVHAWPYISAPTGCPNVKWQKNQSKLNIDDNLFLPLTSSTSISMKEGTSNFIAVYTSDKGVFHLPLF